MGTEHTAPFLPHSQCFPCSTGVWWCLVGLCPGNRISWWQQISAGCDEWLGLSIPLSDASTFGVKKKYQSPHQEKILTSHFNQSAYPNEWICGWLITRGLKCKLGFLHILGLPGKMNHSRELLKLLNFLFFPSFEWHTTMDHQCAL